MTATVGNQSERKMIRGYMHMMHLTAGSGKGMLIHVVFAVLLHAMYAMLLRAIFAVLMHAILAETRGSP